MSEKKKIFKTGIIGCGGIAFGKHMPSLSKLNSVEIAAFCDIDVEKAEKAAKQFGTETARVYSDYKELIKDKSIEKENRLRRYLYVFRIFNCMSW